MRLFQKLAGSFSIKWEFAKMGLSEVSTARIAKNGIPLYRETPVLSDVGFDNGVRSFEIVTPHALHN